MTIAILIVDDDTLVRAGLRMMIETQQDLEVVGDAGNGDEAVALAARLAPDIVLMDIRMPGSDGLAATRRITGAQPVGREPPRVLILTTFEVDEYVYEAVRAGASGFLLKRTRPEDLLAAIRTVADGDALLSPSVTRRLMKEFARVTDRSGPPPAFGTEDLERLTDREREVLLLIAQGQANREIAAQLHLGESTVKTHVKRILMKLGLRDRVHAVVYAYEAGLVSAGEQPM